MTLDEARRQLAAARQADEASLTEDIRTILQPVVDANILTGAEGAEAAYLMGEYCRYTGSLDAAFGYYEFAKGFGVADWTKKADARLAELRRRDDAIDATADGVVQTEATTVLAAADDATGHGNYDEALPLYEQVYQGVVTGEPKLRAALGIARCKAYSNEFDDAIGYASYVEADGSGATKAGATELLTWIRAQQAANTATDDGVQANEFHKVLQAAVSAARHMDYAEAVRLNESVLASDMVPGVDRANAAWNLVMNHLALDEVDKVGEHLQYVLDHGAGPAREYAVKIQAMLADVAAAREFAVAAGPVGPSTTP